MTPIFKIERNLILIIVLVFAFSIAKSQKYLNLEKKGYYFKIDQITLFYDQANSISYSNLSDDESDKCPYTARLLFSKKDCELQIYEKRSGKLHSAIMVAGGGSSFTLPANKQSAIGDTYVKVDVNSKETDRYEIHVYDSFLSLSFSTEDNGSKYLKYAFTGVANYDKQ